VRIHKVGAMRVFGAAKHLRIMGGDVGHDEGVIKVGKIRLFGAAKW
jgi:hypothetical protein